MKPLSYEPWVYWMVDDAWLFDPSDYIAVIFQAEKSGVITDLGIYLGGYFGGQDPRGMTVALQGVDSSGNPDRFNKIYKDFSPLELTPGSFNWLETTTTYTCYKGEVLALVISSAEWGDENDASLYANGILDTGGGFPYTTMSSGRNSSQPIFGYKFETGEAFGMPISDMHFNDSTKYFNAPEERGMRFSLDSAWGDIYRIAGVRWQGLAQSSAGHSYNLNLYQGSKVIQSVNMYGDQGNYGYQSSLHEIYFYKETLANLSFGSEYIIALAPQEPTTGMILDSVSFLSSGNMSALPGGQHFYWVQRTENDWVEDTNRRPQIDLIIDYWGKAAAPQTGMHVKIAPKYNSSLFVEHADDMIHDIEADSIVEGETHEATRTIIGNAIKAYGGFLTVEVFKDPDIYFSIETRLYGEQLVEKLKIVGWETMAVGLYRIVFRFRTAWESENYVDFEQWMRIVA